MTQSKQALSNMLRQRHPNTPPFMQGGMVPNQQPMGGQGMVQQGVGQQGGMGMQQSGMVQQTAMGAQQGIRQGVPVTPMGPSSGPSANQGPQQMMQQGQPQNPGGQMMRSDSLKTISLFISFHSSCIINDFFSL